MTKRQLYQYCPVKKEVVTIEEVYKEKWARNLFIQDEMPPTRNPLNPSEIYTSKAKLREAYRSFGAIEVGDAYERGYKPDRESGASEAKLVSKLKNNLVERFRNG